jgi:hypothetical protein
VTFNLVWAGDIRQGRWEEIQQQAGKEALRIVISTRPACGQRDIQNKE